MIKLILEGKYCHTCPKFEAEVENGYVYEDLGGRKVMIGDTRVLCAHRDMCRNIEDNIKEAVRKEYDNDV